MLPFKIHFQSDLFQLFTDFYFNLQTQSQCINFTDYSSSTNNFLLNQWQRDINNFFGNLTINSRQQKQLHIATELINKGKSQFRSSIAFPISRCIPAQCFMVLQKIIPYWSTMTHKPLHKLQSSVKITFYLLEKHLKDFPSIWR